MYDKFEPKVKADLQKINDYLQRNNITLKRMYTDMDVNKDGTVDKLEFVNGPAAKITDNTSFVVSQYTYPPSYPPGPSSGTCAPVVDSILGGGSEHWSAM